MSLKDKISSSNRKRSILEDLHSYGENNELDYIEIEADSSSPLEEGEEIGDSEPETSEKSKVFIEINAKIKKKMNKGRSPETKSCTEQESQQKSRSGKDLDEEFFRKRLELRQAQRKAAVFSVSRPSHSPSRPIDIDVDEIDRKKFKKMKQELAGDIGKLTKSSKDRLSPFNRRKSRSQSKSPSKDRRNPTAPPSSESLKPLQRNIDDKSSKQLDKAYFEPSKVKSFTGSITGYGSIALPDSPPRSDPEDEFIDASNLTNSSRWRGDSQLAKAELLAALDAQDRAKKLAKSNKTALNAISHESRALSPSTRKHLPNDDQDGSKSKVSSGDPDSDDESIKAQVPMKPFYYPSTQGCRSVEEFECLNRIEEGTYGVVFRARDKKLNEIVALKRLKMEREKDGFPITSLREINTLMKAQHENIVTVREIVVGTNIDKIYLVMDYVEHDLKSLMEIMNSSFTVGQVKCLLIQLLRAVNHMHDNWILHRDLKTSNLLLSHKGILKVGDFGLAREYGSPLKHYTEIVVTLWYRAPELLLGQKLYSTPIDMWSVGCIFAEFLLQRPLFPGKGELDQLNLIFKDLGTPNERIWPKVNDLPNMKKCVFTEYPFNQLRRRFTDRQISDQGFDLLNKLVTYDPNKRITADKAMSHQYFQEKPRAIDPSMFPSWPAKSEGDFVKKRKASPRMPTTTTTNSLQPPPPPLGGQRFFSIAGGDHYASSLLPGSAGSGSRPSLRRTPSNLVAQEDTNFVLKF